MARETQRRDERQRPQGAGRPRASALPPGANDPAVVYDSNLRLALSLIAAADWYQLAARTGILWNSARPQYLSLFIEIDRQQFGDIEIGRIDIQLREQFELLVPSAYVKELERNPELSTLAVRIPLDPKDPSRTSEKQSLLETLLKKLAEQPFVLRLRLAVPHGQFLEQSLAALELPPADPNGDITWSNHDLTGEDIVIGIIDDGCAFAHRDFLRLATDARGLTSRHTRVLALWDQSQLPSDDHLAAGWSKCDDFGFGRELTAAKIDEWLAAAAGPDVDETAAYEAFHYEVGAVAEKATHGTKVMGIAAGNGTSLFGWHGVAPKADIVFVQLPPHDIEHVPQLLSTHIVLGVHYVFERALALGKKAAVVNISYGGYSGPHDGTTPWEQEIDQLLALENRAVVVSAGNAFETDCHAMGTLRRRGRRALDWLLKPQDATVNALEVWYNGDGKLDIALELPGGEVLGPFGFCGKTPLQRASGETVGSIEHVQHDPQNGDNSVLIALGPTVAGASLASVTNAPVLAPAGTWSVTLRNRGSVPVDFHAWVQRDDVAKAGARQQSQFAEGDADPRYTISDFSAGRRAISVGAFNVATGELSSYSSCGPTRAATNYAQDGERRKPDVVAPAEELATGGGVLTSASRASAPRRMNGTSAAAPHVAGIVALVFDFRRNYQGKDLTADELRAALAVQGVPALLPHRRAAKRQRPLLNQLIGAGRISCLKTLQNVEILG